MALARLGGYGFVFVGEDTAASGSAEPSSVATVSMAFQNESYARALNGVLLASGFARQVGRPHGCWWGKPLRPKRLGRRSPR